MNNKISAATLCRMGLLSQLSVRVIFHPIYDLHRLRSLKYVSIEHISSGPLIRGLGYLVAFHSVKVFAGSGYFWCHLDPSEGTLSCVPWASGWETRRRRRPPSWADSGGRLPGCWHPPSPRALPASGGPGAAAESPGGRWAHGGGQFIPAGYGGSGASLTTAGE